MKSPELNPEEVSEVREYLGYILQECNFLIEQSKEVTFEDFKKSPLLIHGFVFGLILIGEYIKRIPADLKNEYPAIPWKEIARMRDRLVHKFYSVDLFIVWETIQKDVPKLKKQIEEIMKKVAEMEEKLNRKDFELGR